MSITEILWQALHSLSDNFQAPNHGVLLLRVLLELTLRHSIHVLLNPGNTLEDVLQ